MPDWKKIVREKLGTLPLSNGRKDEVIEELSQQLESAYEEALAQGINEQEALRRSLAQFKDWEKLRGEVFQSVEGTALPVWEQNGIFSPRRWPGWTALALVLLFLAAPAFRQALAILPVPGPYPTSWNSRVFSEKALRRLERSGDKQKYARALAFVALHSPQEDDLRAMHAAEKAIALDPQLTWISAKVSHATYMIPGYDPHPWVERLKAWDPQNAFPYLLEASENFHWWEPPWSKYSAATNGLRDALAAEPRWRAPMEKAFAAPRVDFYDAQEFGLDRQVLQEQNLDRPDMLLAGSWAAPLPDFHAMKLYSEILLKDVGETAEKSRRTSDALAAYSNLARFGQRLQSNSASYFQRMFAIRFQQDAYEKMLPLLRREGRTEEAAAVEATLATLAELDPGKTRPTFFAGEASAARSGRIVAVSSLLALLFGIATAFWMISVLLLKWKPQLSRGLNRLSSVLCFAPPLLLLSFSALFLGYYPYARSIQQYSSGRELHEGFGLFLMQVYGFMSIDPVSDVWLAHMFWPLIWCAAFALAGAVALKFVARRRRPNDTRAA
jgi:hypothetical protein